MEQTDQSNVIIQREIRMEAFGLMKKMYLKKIVALTAAVALVMMLAVSGAVAEISAASLVPHVIEITIADEAGSIAEGMLTLYMDQQEGILLSGNTSAQYHLDTPNLAVRVLFDSLANDMGWDYAVQTVYEESAMLLGDIIATPGAAGDYVYTYAQMGNDSTMTVMVTITDDADVYDIPDDDVPLCGGDLSADETVEAPSEEPEAVVEVAPAVQQENIEPVLEHEPEIVEEPQPVEAAPVVTEASPPVVEEASTPAPAVEEQPVQEVKTEVVTENDTVEAEIETSQEVSEYTVRFLDAEDNLFVVITVRGEQAITMPQEAPVLAGYTFAYWYDAALGESAQFSFETAITEDITLRPYFVEEGSEEISVEVEAEAPQAETVVEAETEPEPEGLPEGLEVVGTLEGVLDGQTIYIVAIPEEETEAEITEEAGFEPSATINFSYDGEFAFGTEVTLVANLHDVPEGAEVEVQWQNDSSGAFTDVPGAIGETYSFVADEMTSACQWRAMLTVIEPTVAE